MKKILIVFGTRPEAIKIAPLIRQLSDTKKFDVRVCTTGQHREMVESVLRIFNICPDHDLNIMRPNQSLADITSSVITGLSNICELERPDLVLVHGDTSTSFASSLVAFYQRIPVGHVEAGLRTGNLRAPWPEEANRRLTAVLADFHFAPTDAAAANLRKEGVCSDKIIVTGNTVIDALKYTTACIHENPELANAMRNRFSMLRTDGKLLLVTGHRRENFGSGFRDICVALKAIAEQFPDLQIVYPVHLNPNVRTPVYSALSGVPNVALMEPLDYLEFVYLLQRCTLVLTDSGGIQEEAPSLGKPVLVMREQTERPEAVQAGTVKLVGTSPGSIRDAVSELLTSSTTYGRMSRAHNPYGDGFACSRICNWLVGKMEAI